MSIQVAKKSCQFMMVGRAWYNLFSSLVLFRLVAPPLQLGVVGSYPVWGVWFPSHLPLDGTDRIQMFGP
jgi:hypothetical protein